MSLITLEGFHGTNSANIKNIQDNNFKPSIGDAEWLGNGTYFFVEGISNDRHPQTAAEHWAEASSWDNSLKQHMYRECCVLKTTIVIEDDEYFLDLTTVDGMEIFNYYRDKFNTEIKKSRVSFRRDTKVFRDGELINELRDKKGLRIDAVKNSSYIKFKTERQLQIDFRTPNCTILAVYDTTKNIDATKIEIIKKFRI
jgi:hypothetical protein